MRVSMKNNHLIGPPRQSIFKVEALLPGGGRAASAGTRPTLSERYDRKR